MLLSCNNIELDYSAEGDIYDYNHVVDLKINGWLVIIFNSIQIKFNSSWPLWLLFGQLRSNLDVDAFIHYSKC